MKISNKIMKMKFVYNAYDIGSQIIFVKSIFTGSII